MSSSMLFLRDLATSRSRRSIDLKVKVLRDCLQIRRSVAAVQLLVRIRYVPGDIRQQNAPRREFILAKAADVQAALQAVIDDPCPYQFHGGLVVFCFRWRRKFV